MTTRTSNPGLGLLFVIATGVLAGCTSQQTVFRAVRIGSVAPDALAGAIEDACADRSHESGSAISSFFGTTADGLTLVTWSVNDGRDGDYQEALIVVRRGDVPRRDDEETTPLLVGCHARSWRPLDRPASRLLDAWIDDIARRLGERAALVDPARPAPALFVVRVDDLVPAARVTASEMKLPAHRRAVLDDRLRRVAAAWRRE